MVTILYRVAVHALTAVEQAAAIRRGELSPVELVEHYLDRIDRSDLGAFEFLQCLAPNVIEGHRSLDRAMRFFGQIDIFARIAHVRLVQNWIHRMR